LGKARNLARLIVDGTGAVDANNLGNAIPADGSITSAKIADGTIATADIADSAVTTAKIANSNVTADKLASGAAASNLGSYVSSVNGQTGAVSVSSSPPTGFGEIGTYFIGSENTSMANSTVLDAGTTIAGSSLLTTFNATSSGLITGLNRADDAGSAGFIYSNGVSPSLSGTWRRMNRIWNAIGGTRNVKDRNIITLYVRIS
jgi:hypothetical protein